jgi:hypothetical protein
MRSFTKRVCNFLIYLVLESSAKNYADTIGKPPAPGCRVSNPVRGLGARKAAFCCASPTVPLAEPIPETDPSAIRSTASEVVVATAYRHRVTLEALRKMGPLEADRHRRSPSLCTLSHRGRAYPKSTQMKIATKPKLSLANFISLLCTTHYTALYPRVSFSTPRAVYAMMALRMPTGHQAGRGPDGLCRDR